MTRVNFTKGTLALTGGSNSFLSTPFREKHIDRVEDKNKRILIQWASGRTDAQNQS